ncbi:MAG: TrkH family potassium uptake protein [Gammaproteobacteria bacterium]|nr:TrkH family potassium uptake protein [Gammaproteobacteria bacterium]
MSAFLTIVHIFGLITMGCSGLMATSFLTSLIAHDGATEAFLNGTALTFLIGALLFFPTLRARKKVTRQTGFLLVAIAWSVTPVVCTIPLQLYFPSLSFVDAYFECVSGLTTTGATIFSGIDTFPMSINLWRHELNWLGGMGIIILAVAVLPVLGIGGMQLYMAEAPGTVKESDLPPRIAQTAKALWLVYAAITLTCILSLKLAGMDWFDAVCHAFSAMCLGGFSTHDASISYFNSVPIEVVLTLFQLIAAINFASHYVAIKKITIRPYLEDMEFRGILALLGCSCLATAYVLTSAGTYPDYLTSLRHASFNLITFATTCGYMSQDYGQWPIFVPMWMLFLSCLTASSGSTGGGIRMIRTIILLKQTRLELFKFIHPSALKPLRIGDQIINNNIVTSVTGFIFLYFMCAVTLVFALIFTGLDFVTAVSAALASFNNAGPGLNQVGPASNYASLSDVQTTICAFAMILGRVQIFSIIILFVPEFWRK